MPQPVGYIAQIEPPDGALLAKILNKHHVTFDEVREAVVLTDVEGSRWDYSERHGGWRQLVIGTTYRARRLFIVLYPVDEHEGLWRLGTAMDAD